LKSHQAKQPEAQELFYFISTYKFLVLLEYIKHVKVEVGLFEIYGAIWCYQSLGTLNLVKLNILYV